MSDMHPKSSTPGRPSTPIVANTNNAQSNHINSNSISQAVDIKQTTTATNNFSSSPLSNAISHAISIDPSIFNDSGRKKSGFVITRIDKASNSSAMMENDSVSDTEYGGAGGGNSSPGSCSLLSETSTVDGGSLEKPLHIVRAPPPTPSAATPTSPASIFHQQQQPQRPSGLGSTATATATAVLLTTQTSSSAKTAAGSPLAAPGPALDSVIVGLATAMAQTIPTVINNNNSGTVSSSSPSTVPTSSSIVSRETSATSRFHIIKIETGPYKRGRWNCRDYDDSTISTATVSTTTTTVRSDMIAVGPRNGSSNNSSGRPSYHYVADENGTHGHGPSNAGDNPLLLLAAEIGQASQAAVDSLLAQQSPSVAANKPPSGVQQQHQQQQQVSTLTQKPMTSLSAAVADAQHNNNNNNNTSSAFSPVTSTVKGSTLTRPSPPPLQLQLPSVSGVGFPISTSLSNIAQQRSQSPIAPPTTQPDQQQHHHQQQQQQMQLQTVLPSSVVPSRFQVRPAVDLNNAAAAILDSIVGSMHQQQQQHNRTNLNSMDAASRQVAEASLNAAAALVDPIGNVSLNSVGGGTATMGTAVAVSSGFAPGSVGANVVAIDNKIEQAMDLVKTHLLYAVREEVEVLKEKIIDLEKKVFRLETENKLLREYAPPEILQQIQHQQQTQQQHQRVSMGGLSLSSLLLPTVTTNSPQQQHQLLNSASSPLTPNHQQQQSMGTPNSNLTIGGNVILPSATTTTTLSVTTFNSISPPAPDHHQPQS